MARVWHYAKDLRARGFEPWHGASLGNRAYTRVNEQGDIEFWSYSTHVLTITDRYYLGFPIVVEDFGWFSATTAKHKSQFCQEKNVGVRRDWVYKRKRWM